MATISMTGTRHRPITALREGPLLGSLFHFLQHAVMVDLALIGGEEFPTPIKLRPIGVVTPDVEIILIGEKPDHPKRDGGYEI